MTTFTCHWRIRSESSQYTQVLCSCKNNLEGTSTSNEIVFMKGANELLNQIKKGRKEPRREKIIEWSEGILYYYLYTRNIHITIIIMYVYYFCHLPLSYLEHKSKQLLPYWMNKGGIFPFCVCVKTFNLHPVGLALFSGIVMSLRLWCHHQLPPTPRLIIIYEQQERQRATPIRHNSLYYV